MDVTMKCKKDGSLPVGVAEQRKEAERVTPLH